MFSPCGVAGGNPEGCPVGGDPGQCPGGGFGYGPAAENVTFKVRRIVILYTDVIIVLKGAVKTTWRQGGVEKVGWGILANHGGGYSYRLCRVGEQLTEECFQKTPLRSV